MKKIIIIITIVINFSICGFAQERYIKSEVLEFVKKELKTNDITSKKINNKLLIRDMKMKNYLSSNNDSDYYKSRITSGIGFISLSNSNTPARFLFSLYAYINMEFIDKCFYLGLGTDIFPEPKYASIITKTINLIPTIGINLFKNKISVFCGGGLCFYASVITGSILVFKADYNLNDKISFGIDIKYPNFGDQEFSHQTLLLNHINFSFKY
jgi:hypothetical protein